MSGERPEETFAKYIKDDRGGFQVDNPDRIFQMFSRGEFSKGLGLGLANVAGIAARHGGKVRVESLPGMGTTFFVHLTKNI